MFSLFRMGARPMKVSLQAVRTFIPYKKNIPIPTVFKPLPSKRDGAKVMDFVKNQLLEKHDPHGRRRELVSPKSSKCLRAGDIIKITFKDRTNVLGQVLGIKRNGTATNILVRNKITRLGCEMRIPVFSPNITNIEVIEKPKKYLSRGKQYYIRNTRLDVSDLELALKE